MREFKRTLASGVQDSLAAVGDYAYLKAAIGKVKVITETGEEITLEEGQGIRFKKSFKKIDVLNVGDEDLTFIILIGEGEFQNQRLASTQGSAMFVKDVEGVGSKSNASYIRNDENTPIFIKDVGANEVVSLNSYVIVNSRIEEKVFYIPAKNNRESLLLKADLDVGSSCWVGTNVSGVGGVRVFDGDSVEMDVRGVVYIKMISVYDSGGRIAKLNVLEFLS